MDFKIFEAVSKLKFSLGQGPLVQTEPAEAWLLFVPEMKGKAWDSALSFIDGPLKSELLTLVKQRQLKGKAGEVAFYDRGPLTRVVLAVLPKKRECFSLLEAARRAVVPAMETRAKKLQVDLRGAGECAELLARSVCSAVVAKAFTFKKYVAEPDPKTSALPELHYLATTEQSISLERVKSEAKVTDATNFVRYLSALAANDLTPTRYVKLASSFAKGAGLKTDFHNMAALKKLKAGAFLAVSQSASDQGGGILKIAYKPAKAKTKVALVGKGITFDTGGVQIKTGGHMLGMNGDMGGSAVALALVLLAKEMRWPVEVTAYLAITENSIGSQAYRPNEIVTTMAGKTIEVIDTDAEGRMVLADTLHLAAEEKPDLILDFATLTGACVRAIGTQYSGAYTNREEWYERIRLAGRRSGERVWPFPNDEDFGRCLDSDYADIKQCRPTGGVDHIEAGYFLSQFVPESIPWVHVDLSAAENDDGLAHVPSKLTGFGVRFGVEFIQGLLGK
jgi:leucyl aminopeptidase